MTSIKGRLLSSDSEPLLRTVTITVTVIALLSFALSFTSLTELAVAARIPTAVAWGWGLIVDGTIVVATFGTLLLHDRKSWLVRVYPWAILVLFGVLSIYANGIHAISSTLTDTEAFIVGSVAPFALLTSTHLLVIMLTSPVRGATDEELEREALAAARAVLAESRTAAARARAEAAQAPAQATERPLLEPVMVAEPATPGPAMVAATVVPADDIDDRARAWRAEHGDWPSGAEVGRWMGKSAKTGTRRLAKIKTEETG